MSEELYGLIGRKLGHSYSVPIHRQLGCPEYSLYELEPEELGPFLAHESIRGLNVTVPYKRAVIPFCASLSPEAEATGSVNTLVREDGGLKGYNTDLFGFGYMAERAGISFAGQKVLVFGNGGVSQTVQAAVKKAGARELAVISRRGSDNYENLSRHYNAGILINATPLGMYPEPGAMPADPGLFPGCRAVLDLVYNPRRTAFLMRAEQLGLPRSDGLPMLAAQALAAEELFTRRRIDPGAIERILRELRRDSGNIILIGMPGCGKTVTGLALGKLTGREALDVDGEIERSQGMSIPELFARLGESGFRRLEREITARLGMGSGKIIMTGGGVVLDRANYPSLHQNGRIYHLCRDLSLLETQGRPLSQRGSLREMYQRRLPLYRDFRDVEIDNNGALSDTADAVWRDQLEHSGD